VHSDDEEEDSPETPAPEASKRTPDRGDFNVNDDKVITAYFKNNLRDSTISESQREQLVKKVVNIWSTANPEYHKHKLGNNFTGNNKLGRLIVNAVKTDTSLLKGLNSYLDKHIAKHDANIKDLEVTISGMITTQQHQKDTAAANKANQKAAAAAKANTTAPVTVPTITDTTTPLDKQNPKPKGNAIHQYFNHQTPSSSSSNTTTSSPPTNISTASSTNTSTASDSATSTASSISTAVSEGNSINDEGNSSNLNHTPSVMVEGDDPVQ
jgi:hypothetical protein